MRVHCTRRDGSSASPAEPFKTAPPSSHVLQIDQLDGHLTLGHRVIAAGRQAGKGNEVVQVVATDGGRRQSGGGAAAAAAAGQSLFSHGTRPPEVLHSPSVHVAQATLAYELFDLVAACSRVDAAHGRCHARNI